MNLRLRTDPSAIYSRTEKGWFVIAGKRCFFRSAWEITYARYLEWLKQKREIIDWEYEAETFWFEKIKRGVRSYMPDFKVTEASGVSYHEVKGWLDPKSKTKLARMGRYYPEIKVVLISEPKYKAIKQWERLFPPAEPVEELKKAA